MGWTVGGCEGYRRPVFGIQIFGLVDAGPVYGATARVAVMDIIVDNVVFPLFHSLQVPAHCEYGIVPSLQF